MGTSNSQPVGQSAGKNQDCDWHLKWGQPCGMEPSAQGPDALSRELVSELSCLVVWKKTPPHMVMECRTQNRGAVFRQKVLSGFGVEGALQTAGCGVAPELMGQPSLGLPSSFCVSESPG